MKITLAPKLLLGTAFLSGVFGTTEASRYIKASYGNNDKNAAVKNLNIKSEKNNNHTNSTVHDANANILIATGAVIPKMSKEQGIDSITNSTYKENLYELLSDDKENEWVYDVDETGVIIKRYPHGIVKSFDE